MLGKYDQVKSISKKTIFATKAVIWLSFFEKARNRSVCSKKTRVSSNNQISRIGWAERSISLMSLAILEMVFPFCSEGFWVKPTLRMASFAKNVLLKSKLLIRNKNASCRKILQDTRSQWFLWKSAPQTYWRPLSSFYCTWRSCLHDISPWSYSASNHFITICSSVFTEIQSPKLKRVFEPLSEFISEVVHVIRSKACAWCNMKKISTFWICFNKNTSYSEWPAQKITLRTEL